MTRRRILELLAAAAVVAALAVVVAASSAAELPAALVQGTAGLAAPQPKTDLFQSPLMTVGGYNGQVGALQSPLVADAIGYGQPGGSAQGSQLAVLYFTYLPWVARQGSDSVSSAIFLYNASGATPASVIVTFCDETGAFVAVVDALIPANGTVTFEQATMTALPLGYEGSAVVESDSPVMAVVNLAPGTRDQLLTYNGIADPSRDALLPLVTRNAAGSTTNLWIQNASPSTTSLEITYHPYGGGAGCTDIIEDVPPYASLSLDGETPSCVGDGFYGLASVQAAQPVAAVAAMWQLGRTGASAYEGVASSVSLQVPVLPYRQLAPRQEKKSLSDWSSSVLMANVGTATATMAANWYDGDGSGPVTDSNDVPVGQRMEYYLPALGILADGFDGSLVVESDQPFALVSGWANPSEPGDGFAMNPGIPENGTTLASAGTVIHLPRLAHGPDSSTQFSIQNAATLEATATVTITYHDQGGAASAVVEDTIPFQGVKRYYTWSVPDLGSEWQGSATILSTQPIAAEVMQFLFYYPPDTCPEVSSPSDSGTGTLRNCLQSASSGDTITFDPIIFPPGSPTTISVDSQLPSLTQGNLTIDGSNAGVVINGSNTHTEMTTVGFWVSSDYNVIKGLQILNFPSSAIWIKNAAYNVIGGDNTVGSGPAGEGNVLSGSSKGVYIDGTGAVSNTILGNLIGLDVSGGISLPNEYQGVAVYEGADYTTIGGTAPGHGNAIAGNEHSGLLLWSDHNVVEGNLIGLDAAGSVALPNETGIQINSGATQNAIRDNVISGNRHGGVAISDSGTMSNTISGNLIGMNATGAAVISSGGTGVDIYGGASRNLVGGDSPGEGNVIAGFEHSGISTTGWGNRIGYNEVYGNAEHGVHVKGTDALTNTISHNSIHDNVGLGIRLEDGGNAGLPAPVISSYDMAGGVAAGTACALCTVEVFSDGEDEGETFEGSTAAAGGGIWTLDTGVPFTGPKLTATASDLDGNTSEFGVLRHYEVYLPVVLRNAGAP